MYTLKVLKQYTVFLAAYLSDLISQIFCYMFPINSCKYCASLDTASFDLLVITSESYTKN